MKYLLGRTLGNEYHRLSSATLLQLAFPGERPEFFSGESPS